MSFGKQIESILNASTIDAIRSSACATCELLDPSSHFRCPVALTTPRDLSKEECSLLKTLVLDSQSWFFAVKRCRPLPTALFQFLGNNVVVSVSIDTCDGWIVTSPDESKGGFFDPVRSKVRELLKSTFPELASPNRRSMWIAGAIASLRAQSTNSAAKLTGSKPNATKSKTYLGQPRGE